MESFDKVAELIDIALEKHFSRADDIAKERFASLDKRLDILQSDILLLKKETGALRIDYVTLMKRTKKVERSSGSLAKSLMAVEAKLADLEDRSRRNNVCVHGSRALMPHNISTSSCLCGFPH